MLAGELKKGERSIFHLGGRRLKPQRSKAPVSSNSPNVSPCRLFYEALLHEPRVVPKNSSFLDCTSKTVPLGGHG